jgi:pimeloyl-ACP methyl ester carboxylesterase
MQIPLNIILLTATTIYQAIACWVEDRTPPPGKLVDIEGHYLHLYTLGTKKPTIVLDHSLGGIEGYFLIEKLSEFGRVCICDRLGYGWSNSTLSSRTSQQIVTELDSLLVQAKIEPPYILIGDSFGSYNMRLYAHQYPEKVVGLILTDGLHETGMLKMSLPLQALKMFFISGFLMSVLGSILGIIRLLNLCGIFELVKPELQQCSPTSLKWVKRSFCRPQHWVTMARELWNIEASSKQVKMAQDLGNLPVVNIKANSFFKPSIWTKLIPLNKANQLRDEMHLNLMNISTNCHQISTTNSGHFVWLDEPEAIAKALEIILDNPLLRKDCY